MMGVGETQKEAKLSYRKLIESLIPIEEPLNDEKGFVETREEATCEDELLEALN